VDWTCFHIGDDDDDDDGTFFYNDGTPQLGQMHHNCLGDCIV